MWPFKRRPARPRTDRVGNLLFQIFGPATVEGALQGWSPEAQAQYKRMRENQRRRSAPDA